jgi:GNAT superfamily N-acetyltransferase
MSQPALRAELAAGVEFSGWETDGELVAVMGIEHVRDGVTLIRHAYTRKQYQGRDIGAHLLEFLVTRTDGPLLVGTWAGATWAIRFYERLGSELASPSAACAMLDAYWRVPQRQKEPTVSVVLFHRTRLNPSAGNLSR